MLKNCISKSTNFANSKFFNTKCGEVICQSESCFAIICEYCELKLFDFDDFLQHFRNVHFDFESQLKSQNNSAKDSINCNETKIEQTDSSENFTENVLQTTASGDTEYVSLKREIDIFEHHILLDNRIVYDGDNSVHESDKEQNYDEEDCMELDESECNSAEDEDWYPHNRNVYNAKESRLSQTSQKFQQNVDTNLEAEEDDIPHSIIRDPVVPAKTPTKKQHKCEFCNKVYTTAKTLKIHTKIKHIKPKTHKCTNCEEAFLDTRSLNSHIKKKHTTYACSNCDRTYKNAESLRVHLLNHKNVKDFVCPYDNCSKAFVSQRRLKVHIEIHTDKRNYVCEVCGYRSRSKHALEVHKRGHTGEKPFKCPNCDRSFASKSLVNEHQAMHMTDRPFKCEVCDATFARPKALYHHKHLHLAEKKFKCKLCGSAYAQAAGLSAHMRQHRLEDAGLA